MKQKVNWPKPSYKSLEDSNTRLRVQNKKCRKIVKEVIELLLKRKEYLTKKKEREETFYKGLFQMHLKYGNDIADELILHNCGKRCRVCTVIKKLRSNNGLG